MIYTLAPQPVKSNDHTFKANIQIIKELIGDVNMSEELLELVKPIIEHAAREAI